MTLVTADLMGGTESMGGESDHKEGGALQNGGWVRSQLVPLCVPAGMGIGMGVSCVSLVIVDLLRDRQNGMISRFLFATFLH